MIWRDVEAVSFLGSVGVFACARLSRGCPRQRRQRNGKNGDSDLAHDSAPTFAGFPLCWVHLPLHQRGAQQDTIAATLLRRRDGSPPESMQPRFEDRDIYI